MSNTMSKFNQTPLEDYYLRHRLQDILQDKWKSHNLKWLAKCGTIPLNYQNVDVVIETYTNDKHYARFYNLNHCGSAWCCPVCAPYKLKKQALIAEYIIKQFAAKGRLAFLLTFTVPHLHYEPLSKVMDRLQNTFRRSAKAIQKFRLRLLGGREQMIKSTEVTYSRNHGWHPHFHVIVFCDADKWSNVPEFVEHWKRNWKKSCLVVSNWSEEYYESTFSNKKFTDVYLSVNRNGTPYKVHDANYICSYGNASDIASEAIKISNSITFRKSGFKSTQMFDLIASDDPKDHDLFIEYAMVTKGKPRVNYSRNIHREVDWSGFESFDEALHAKATKKKVEVVCSFTASDWSKLIRLSFERREDYRSAILKLVLEYRRYDVIFRFCSLNDLPLPILSLRKYKRRQHEQRAA